VGAATAGIWDGGQLDRDELTSLRAFCRRFRGAPTPVVALVDFPRPEHLAELREVGAAALVGKPCSLTSLIDEVERVLAESPVAAANGTLLV
jgi:AmiR/NasT family two-component response regulator